MDQTKTSVIVETITAGYLTEFNNAERASLEALGALDNGVLYSAARIDIKGGHRGLIVNAPHGVGGGLVRFFTPTLPHASCLIPVDGVEAVYFSD